MGSKLRSLVVMGLAAVALTGSAASAVSSSGGTPSSPTDVLQEDLDTILSDHRLDDAQASVEVRRLDGRVLYARTPDARVTPASNNKLFDSTSALDVLGPAYAFDTEVLSTGTRAGGVLDGDLYLRGSGDLSLQASDLDDLAARTAASGVRQVTGRLVADDTAFDNVRLGDSWGWDDESASYAPGISALTVSPNSDENTDTAIVSVEPGGANGKPARVSVTPATDFVRIDDRATTTASGTPDLTVQRLHGTNTVRVTGTIPIGAQPDRTTLALADPTGYAAALFRADLTRHGVRVLGPTALGEATPAGASTLAHHRSAPLSTLLTRFLKPSNNGHAELLTKAMGLVSQGKGTWAAGLAAESSALGKLGVDTSQLRLADGSGLSRKNLASAHQLTNILIAAHARPWFTTWYDALPIAGDPDPWVGGTLSGRMRGTAAAENVHGKTGSLTGASALSGYVTDKDGQLLVFSIVHNNYLGDINPKTLEDQIAVRLANFTEKPAGARHLIPRLPRTHYGPAGVECSWARAC